MDISGNFILMGFNRILKLVKSNKIFIYREYINRIFKLIESSKFFIYRVDISGILISVEFSKIPSLVGSTSGKNLLAFLQHLAAFGS